MSKAMLLIFFLYISSATCNHSYKNLYEQYLPQKSSTDKCISRNYGNGGTVCVCNSSYCDKIPGPPKISSSEFWMYTSNLAGLRFHQTRGTFQPVDNRTSDVIIDHSKTFQTIFGWGGAFTDSVGINLGTLSDSTQELLLKQYFSLEGIEYSLGRVPIGGTDFSVRAYTYDDGPPDPSLLNFKLTFEDYKYKIPYIKRALNMTGNNLQLYATAWTAPPWMKTNHNYSGFGFIQKYYYQPWANYHVKFLDEYQKRGISFWAITTGNEPFDALILNDRLGVVGWPPTSLRLWIQNHLGPTIQNFYPNTKIMIFEDQRAFLPWYIKFVLNDSIARKYIAGIAYHWYLNQYFPPEILTQTQKIFPEKFLLASEACNGFRPSDVKVLLGSWERGEFYSIDIIQNLLNWVIGWVDWNIALNLQGGPNYINNFVDSPIIINATSGEFYKQPMFYHLGHFSKFIPRGSVRILVEKNNRNIETVAFQRPDNGTVVVLLNRSNQSQSLNIKNGLKRVAQVVVTPRSITTILFW